jgi:uncharacterized protein (DUF934 family)
MTKLLRQQAGHWQIGRSESINWVTPEQFQADCALMLEVSTEPQTEWINANIIAIEFPAFTDGRGLSLAALLRQRVGFSGDLRVVCAVHEDIVHFMLRCGFDSFELPEDRDPTTVLEQLTPYSQHYQGSVMAPFPTLLRTAI